MFSPLVTTVWLAEQFGQENLRIVDARWRGDGTSSRELYRQGHIPGAIHLDWQLDLSWADARGVRDLLLPPAQFAEAMQGAGIGDDSLVVAYADSDYSGATRLWWALRYHGHEKVAVLDGGWDKWLAEGRSVSWGEELPVTISPTLFTPRPQARLLATQAEITDSLSRKDAQTKLVDTRPPEQYRGEAVWTPGGSLYLTADAQTIGIGGRTEMRAGHIPGAINLHASPTFLDQQKWTYLSGPLIRQKAEDAGLYPEQRIITYCGVGISASLGLFGLYLAGYKDLALYDASWEEWGTDPDCPVERSLSTPNL